jgi:PRTRC genetic system protein B
MDLSWIGNALKPFKIIVAYKSDHDFYMEVHGINEKGISPGVPLSKQAMNKMIKSVKQSAHKMLKFKDIIPENIIHYNCDPITPYLIWFSPAGKKKLYWTAQMQIPDGEAHVPPMVFILKNQELDVYAVSENRRPNMKSALFNVPFCNVDDEGGVCTGNVSLPDCSFIDDLMKSYESIFWDTRFSGHGLDNEAIIKGFNFYHFWKDRISKPGEVFPVEVLIPTKKRLEDLI